MQDKCANCGKEMSRQEAKEWNGICAACWQLPNQAELEREQKKRDKDPAKPLILFGVVTHRSRHV